MVSVSIVTVCICISQVEQGREEGVDGIVDRTFQWLDPVNQYFREDLSRRNALEIFCGLMMDLIQLTQFYRWIWYGTTFRIWVASITFFIVRALVQSVIILQFPEGFNWSYPGFFSVFVPYAETPDFFFSGHTGVTVINILEFRACGGIWLYLWSYLAVFNLCLQIFQFEVLRVHYCVDIMTGAIVAHYIYILTERYIHVVDVWIFGIPPGQKPPTGQSWHPKNGSPARTE